MAVAVVTAGINGFCRTPECRNQQDLQHLPVTIEARQRQTFERTSLICDSTAVNLFTACIR